MTPGIDEDAGGQRPERPGTFRVRINRPSPVAAPPPADLVDSPPVADTPPARPVRRLPMDGVRLVGLVLVTVVAYRHSLEDLVGTLAYDTPLAYLGLVPVLALGLGIARARQMPPVPVGALEARRLPDRDVDWIVGLPLLGLAAWIGLVLPDRLDYAFWISRIDVLGMPFFVAGLVAILFGTGVLRRVLPAVGLLGLAWPVPWEATVDELLAGSQQATLHAVRAVSPAVGGRNTGDTLFEIGTGAGAFVVNVAPQCAGANGVVGWLLIAGTACFVLPRGRRAAKLAWIAAGVGLLFVANVARISGLFALGAVFGESVAIDWVHPYVGLVIFVLVVLGMARLLPRFGLPALGDALARPTGDGTVAPTILRRQRPVSLPVVAVLVLAVVTMAPANAALERFDPFRDVDSAAAIPFARVADGIEGYRGSVFDTVEWGVQYFGSGSTWVRHRYNADLSASPIYVDLISTKDLRTFSEFGVEACYSFHDYDIAETGRVDVGAAADAQHLTFFNLDTGSWWTAVSVVQATDDVDGRRYERILSLTPLGGNDPDVEPAPERVAASQDLLVDFARATVEATRG